VQITGLTSGNTEHARKLACDKMAAGDYVWDSAVRNLVFIMYSMALPIPDSVFLKLKPKADRRLFGR